MATEALIAKRRMEAETAINNAVSALATRHKIEIETETFPVRDLEMKRLFQLENLAKELDLIVEAGSNENKKDTKKADEKETEKEVKGK